MIIWEATSVNGLVEYEQEAESFKELFDALDGRGIISDPDFPLYDTELLEKYGKSILKNGDLSFATGGKWNDTTKEFEGYVLMPAFQENETCEFDEMEKRIDALVCDLVQKQ